MTTMKLDGGILTYSDGGGINNRYLINKSPQGRKVVFMNKNGYPTQRQNAEDILGEGAELIIKEIYVGQSSSAVEFLEHPGKRFNTVMFADVD